VSATSPRRDDLGDEVVPAGRVERIVSLVPNLSELLWSWGLGDRLVGVTEWCVVPPEGFPHARRVRGTKNPDIAAIVALAPDLVLASEEENRQLDVERLRSAGLAVHVTRVRTLAALPDSLHRLAGVLDVPTAAARLVEDIEAALAACQPPARRLRAACAIWRDDPERGGDEEGWWLLGRATYAGDLLDRVGVQVLPADAQGRYPRCSLAELRALEPELVLLPDEPYAFGATDADELGRVGLAATLVDGMDLWWWGPRTPGAITRLARVAR
jgi:ABC-type Fe3+-hydroxamate transport system substrate-binding protein